MSHLPVIHFSFAGDRVEGTVLKREIVVNEFEGETVKSLAIDLELTEPRTEDGITFLEGRWYLRNHSQALAELNRVLKVAGAPPGSPFPGDWLGIELGGFRPPTKVNRSPKKLFVISYVPRDEREELL